MSITLFFNGHNIIALRNPFVLIVLSEKSAQQCSSPATRLLGVLSCSMDLENFKLTRQLLSADSFLFPL